MCNCVRLGTDEQVKEFESLLEEHIEKLHQVAGVLLEKEKIDGEEFLSIMNS